MVRLRARADVNQREITAALRAIGASVQPLHTVGKGCADLLCGYRGRNVLIEVKAGKGTLTEDEAHWHECWRGQVAIVRTVNEAIAVLLHGTPAGAPAGAEGHEA